MLKEKEIIEVIIYLGTDDRRQSRFSSSNGVSLCKITTDQNGKKKVMEIATINGGETVLIYPKKNRKKKVQKK